MELKLNYLLNYNPWLTITNGMTPNGGMKTIMLIKGPWVLGLL
jgi:hypothetical protein